MSEEYVVRKAEGGPDLVWIARVEWEPSTGRGRIVWQGGLEGQVDDIEGDRAALEQQFATWREVDGYQIDRIP